MGTFLLVIHIFICIFLIFIVLIQSSKGSQMGAAFGGSSQTIFGSRGAATFLSKFTTIIAVVFMLSSLFLAILAVRKGSIVKPSVTTTVPSEERIPVEKAGVKPSEEKPRSSKDTPSKEK